MKILFVMSGGHPVHMKFAESINAEIYKVKHNVEKKQFVLFKIINLLLNSFSIPSGYDVYITESCFYYPAIKRKLGLLKGKIINLNSSPLQYWMKTNRIKGIEKKTLQYLLDSINGQIFLGKKWQKELNWKKPSVVSYSFISEENFETLSKIKPNLESKNICIIASQDYYYKGLDLLIDSFKIVKKKYSESNLYVIGKINVPEEYQNVEGVHLLGRVDKIEEVFEKCSLYAHPARGECFAVSILEAMCAGLPVIVSEETGNCELFEEKHITKLDIKDISSKIINYFEMDNKEKMKISKQNQEISKKFKEEKIIIEFKTLFQKLIGQ